jgi:tRNA threonylcarbamoyladenosine biosynthesis protein TsaB
LGLVISGDTVLSLLDARINEVYWSVVRMEQGLAQMRLGPFVCPPAELMIEDQFDSLRGVGSGFCYRENLPASIETALCSVAEDVLPAARDIIPLALEKLARGDTQRPHDVLPVYVRDEVSWKKLAEQGKPG